jgi:hypothetical protein
MAITSNMAPQPSSSPSQLRDSSLPNAFLHPPPLTPLPWQYIHETLSHGNPAPNGFRMAFFLPVFRSKRSYHEQLQIIDRWHHAERHFYHTSHARHFVRTDGNSEGNFSGLAVLQRHKVRGRMRREHRHITSGIYTTSPSSVNHVKPT